MGNGENVGVKWGGEGIKEDRSMGAWREGGESFSRPLLRASATYGWSHFTFVASPT